MGNWTGGYFDSIDSVTSTIGIFNTFLALTVIGITDWNALTVVSLILPIAAAFANGLFYFGDTENTGTTTVVLCTVAHLCWFVGEAGLNLYSYFILIRILDRIQRRVFQFVFFFLLGGTLVTRIFIIYESYKPAPNNRTGLMTIYNLAYFGSIAITEIWSAAFLLHTFFRARNNSSTVAAISGPGSEGRGSALFRELVRSTEVRVATLVLVGITRTVTHIFMLKYPDGRDGQIAGDIDGFVCIVECVFPVIMMIDVIASRRSHLEDVRRQRRGGRPIHTTANTASTDPSRHSRRVQSMLSHKSPQLADWRDPSLDNGDNSNVEKPMTVLSSLTMRKGSADKADDKYDGESDGQCPFSTVAAAANWRTPDLEARSYAGSKSS